MISTEGVSHRDSDITVEREVAHFLATGESDLVGSGLPFSRSKEWLLQIRFAKRETFAYAGEAYGRILVNIGARKCLAGFSKHGKKSRAHGLMRVMTSIKVRQT